MYLGQMCTFGMFKYKNTYSKKKKVSEWKSWQWKKKKTNRINSKFTIEGIHVFSCVYIHHKHIHLQKFDSKHDQWQDTRYVGVTCAL